MNSVGICNEMEDPIAPSSHRPTVRLLDTQHQIQIAHYDITQSLVSHQDVCLNEFW